MWCDTTTVLQKQSVLSSCFSKTRESLSPPPGRFKMQPELVWFFTEGCRTALEKKPRTQEQIVSNTCCFSRGRRFIGTVGSGAMAVGRHPAAIPLSSWASGKLAAVRSRFPTEWGLIELSVDRAGERGRGNLLCFRLSVKATQTRRELSLPLPGKPQHAGIAEFKVAADAKELRSSASDDKDAHDEGEEDLIEDDSGGRGKIMLMTMTIIIIIIIIAEPQRNKTTDSLWTSEAEVARV